MRSHGDHRFCSAIGILSFFVAGILCVTAVGRAVTSPRGGDTSALEVDRRGEESLSSAARGVLAEQAIRALERSADWNRYLARNPGWTARWDLQRSAPERMQGPPSTVIGYPLVDDRNAEAAARAFLSREASSIVPSDELVFLRAVGDRRGYWVHFQQQHRGIPIWNSRATVRLSRAGSVSLLTNRTFTNINAPVTPTVGADAAMDGARIGLPGTPKPAGQAELTLLPIRKADRYDYRLTWRSEHRTTNPPGDWISFVDAVDGELLWRYNNVRYAEVSGRVTGLVEPSTADEDFQSLPLPYLLVTVDLPDTTVVTGLTDPEGQYALTTSTETGRLMSLGLSGIYGFVYNAADGTLPTASFPLADGDPLVADYQFDDASAEPSERDVYYHAMVAHDYIQVIAPAFHLLDYSMPLIVNINEQCNAFWDGYGVNFFAASDRCANTARIADVVYHEYAHGITDYLYRPFMPSGAMHEGFSDYYGASITNQPLIGRGFYGPGSYLRRLDEDRVYPQDWIDEVHYDGLILASALWDLREIFGQAKADSLWHFACYGYSDNYDDYFIDYLLTNDDNDNIYDGAPDFGPITSVFRAHGIGDYAIHVSHIPHPDTEDLGSPLSLTATFLSVFPLVEGSVQAHITVLHGTDTTTLDPVMTPTGATREYTTTLAAQAAETTIRYYFTASDTAGTAITYPTGGAADPFVFYVGTDVTGPTIAHDPLPDQPAAMTALRVPADVTDNLDQPLQYVNLHFSRNGGEVSTLAMTGAGGARYIGEIPFSGFSVGDLVEYSIEARDGASTPNTSTDPPAGWHSFHLVQGYLKDLEADNGGLTGDHDWEWGIPSAPMGAYSGEKVWATNLEGLYENNTLSVLALPTIDLSTFTKAGFVFHHAYLTEPEYDGGFVEISTDGGTNWSLLVPDGGYDTNIIAVGGTPGYSGGSGEWLTAQFDLYRYVGQSDCRIRLTFASDQGVTALGWYVDDLEVVERQIMGRPIDLKSRSGLNHRVRLSWNPPAGIDESGPSPVTGYYVYRSETSEPIRLTPGPVLDRAYTDTSAVNGQLYHYYVSALYGATESPMAGPVEGMAYVATYSADLASLSAVSDSSGVIDTTLTVTNSGSGVLWMNVYIAGADQEINDVRILYETADSSRAGRPLAPPREFSRRAPQSDLVDLHQWISPGRSLKPLPERRAALRPPPADWDTLATDADDDSLINPDLAAVGAKQTTDIVYFLLTAHEPWGDPATDFSFFISINTDDNVETGFGGGEYIILAGAVTQQAFGVPALLVDSSFQPVALLDHLILDPGATAGEFGIAKQTIESPERVTLRVTSRNADGSVILDRAPDNPSFTWLSTSDRHLDVAAGDPQALGILLDTTRLLVGSYEAKLYFDTNDPAQALVTFPVTFTVTPLVPIALEEFTAEPGDGGVVIHWLTSSSEDGAFFHLFRREVAPREGEETRLTEDPIPSSRTGVYRFVDRSAQPGREYRYRLLGLGSEGETILERILTVSTQGLVHPVSLWLDTVQPNPGRSRAAVRYGLPSAATTQLSVVAADGRRVRILDRMGRKAAGYYGAEWDGADDAGGKAAAGIYFFRLEADDKVITRKVTWLR